MPADARPPASAMNSAIVSRSQVAIAGLCGEGGGDTWPSLASAVRMEGGLTGLGLAGGGQGLGDGVDLAGDERVDRGDELGEMVVEPEHVEVLQRPRDYHVIAI